MFFALLIRSKLTSAIPQRNCSLPSRRDIGIAGGDVAGRVAGAFMDGTHDPAGWSIGTTLRLERAGKEVCLACAVSPEAILIDAGSRFGIVAIILSQRFSAGAPIAVVVLVVAEVRAFEGAVAPGGMVEHRNMRRDALLDQPGEVVCRSIAGVASEA